MRCGASATRCFSRSQMPMACIFRGIVVASVYISGSMEEILGVHFLSGCQHTYAMPKVNYTKSLCRSGYGRSKPRSDFVDSVCSIIDRTLRHAECGKLSSGFKM